MKTFTTSPSRDNNSWRGEALTWEQTKVQKIVRKHGCTLVDQSYRKSSALATDHRTPDKGLKRLPPSILQNGGGAKQNWAKLVFLHSLTLKVWSESLHVSPSHPFQTFSNFPIPAPTFQQHLDWPQILSRRLRNAGITADDVTLTDTACSSNRLPQEQFPEFLQQKSL